jgi:hypothetical protein
MMSLQHKSGCMSRRMVLFGPPALFRCWRSARPALEFDMTYQWTVSGQCPVLDKRMVSL